MPIGPLAIASAASDADGAIAPGHLAKFFVVTGQVPRLDAAMVVNASRTDLADSVFHAPAAGFGDEDFYPDLYDKAAVLTCRNAWNHPLPDGNKRAAWACLVMFIDLNGGRWSPDSPLVEAAVTAMLAVAARKVNEQQLARGYAIASGLTAESTRGESELPTHGISCPVQGNGWSVALIQAVPAEGGSGSRASAARAEPIPCDERGGDSQMPRESVPRPLTPMSAARSAPLLWIPEPSCRIARWRERDLGRVRNATVGEYPVRVQAPVGDCGSASALSHVRGTRRRSPTLMHRRPSPVSRNRCASL